MVSNKQWLRTGPAAAQVTGQSTKNTELLF